MNAIGYPHQPYLITPRATAGRVVSQPSLMPGDKSTSAGTSRIRASGAPAKFVVPSVCVAFPGVTGNDEAEGTNGEL